MMQCQWVTRKFGYRYRIRYA